MNASTAAAPQPPMRISSNLTTAATIKASSSPSTASESQLDTLDPIHHQSSYPVQCQTSGSGNNGGCGSGTQIHLVSALQSNYNSGTNPSNTSTLKKRVQIQEVTV